MNDLIITNLYEFWRHVGALTDRLVETKDYSAVSLDHSDWPNRVFDLHDGVIEQVLKLSKNNQLPEIITLAKPNGLNSNPYFEFMFGQRNMALDLKSISDNRATDPHITRVKTEKEAIDFAKSASEAFGYRVDPYVIFQIVNNSKTVRLFIYQDNGECLGCGIVFFDSNNNAGLHMIGTLSKGRGRGTGKSMTEKLLQEAKENSMNYCVLHASLMGESIYKRLGFIPYGEIETYRIQK